MDASMQLRQPPSLQQQQLYQPQPSMAPQGYAAESRGLWWRPQNSVEQQGFYSYFIFSAAMGIFCHDLSYAIHSLNYQFKKQPIF
jgi:hypothetical protein